MHWRGPEEENSGQGGVPDAARGVNGRPSPLYVGSEASDVKWCGDESLSGAMGSRFGVRAATRTSGCGGPQQTPSLHPAQELQ